MQREQRKCASKQEYALKQLTTPMSRQRLRKKPLNQSIANPSTASKYSNSVANSSSKTSIKKAFNTKIAAHDNKIDQVKKVKAVAQARSYGCKEDMTRIPVNKVVNLTLKLDDLKKTAIALKDSAD